MATVTVTIDDEYIEELKKILSELPFVHNIEGSEGTLKAVKPI